jgi:integrase
MDARSADSAQWARLRAAVYDSDRPHVARAQLLPRHLETSPESLRPRHPPHECRHSYVTHLRAAGINDADLAEIAGHRVETMLAQYTHAVGSSFIAVRDAIDSPP